MSVLECRCNGVSEKRSIKANAKLTINNEKINIDKLNRLKKLNKSDERKQYLLVAI